MTRRKEPKVTKGVDSRKYRADSRTPEQFAADIKAGAEAEAHIIESYCKMTGSTYKELGHDDGTEIRKRSSAQADYLVDGKPVEIKFCREFRDEFHLKKHHIDSYIKQNAMLLFVMAYDTPEAMYCMIDPNEIITRKVKVFWNKLTYHCKVKEFEWHEFVKIPVHL